MFTPAFSDGLGLRLLAFDAESGTSFERLQFKPELGNAAGFEAALRDRVAKLKHLHNGSLASIRTVDRLPDEGLVLESKHTAGRRLSELFPQARGPIFAIELIRHLTPLVAMLHQAGPDISHGLLTAERVVATRDGRLVMVEHVLGSAVAGLGWPASRLRAEFGLALPPGQWVPLDARTDLIQLGFLALSLLAGQRLDAADYPNKIEQHLIEAAPASQLRSWLDRALQIGSRPFVDAQEAMDALSELPDGAAVVEQKPPSRAVTLAREQSAKREPRPAPAPVSTTPVPHPVPERFPTADEKSTIAAVSERVMERLAGNQVTQPTVPANPAPAPVPPTAPKISKHRQSRGMTARGWITAGLTVVAAVEAVVIVIFMLARPEQVVLQVPAPHLMPTVEAAPAPNLAALLAAAPAKLATAEPPPVQKAADAASDRPAPAADRFGGVKLSCPIELQVFENGKLAGSTAGPIAAMEGPHTFELVNDAVGFRVKENVTVKPGQMATVAVPLPNGRISINAVPWADVLIDGTSAGQTPLANLSIPIGTHEIVFRHPQFEEQRQRIVVKPEGLTRVSATLQK